MNNFDRSIEQCLTNLCNYASTLGSHPECSDPRRGMNHMYKTLNPAAIDAAVCAGRKALAQLITVGKQGVTSKTLAARNEKDVDIYFTIGGDGNTYDMFEGAISSATFIPEYVQMAGESGKYGITPDEVKTTLKVLRTIGLPRTIDSVTNEHGKLINSTGYYTAYLTALMKWLSTCRSIKQSAIMNEGMKHEQKDLIPTFTNMEISRWLTSIAMNKLPSVPFTTFYIGKIPTSDPAYIASKMSSSVDFRKYMTDESITINMPQFVVSTGGDPVVGIAGHPLVTRLYGNINSGNTEWYGLFQSGEEFEKIALSNGLTVSEIQAYMATTSYEQYQIDLAKGDNPIAKFISEQKLLEYRIKLSPQSRTSSSLIDMEDDL